ALRLGTLAERRKAGGLARAASVAALGLAATQLAACTSLFGGNIKGSFACNAPNGTCAPSTVIDDQALSVIQNARPMTPAGPYMRSPASPRATTADYVPTGLGRITPAQGGMAHRERRVLRVVFPSFVDGGGNLHEPRIVHAVVDDGAWMQLSGSEPTAIDQIEGRSASLASAAFIPPSLPDASILPSDVSPAPEVKPAPAGPPSPEAVAAARAKGAALKAGSAIDAIRAEVQSRLAQTAKAPGAVQPAGALAPNAAQGAAHTAAPVDAVKPGPGTAAPVNGPAAFPSKVEE
ncbi:conjugation transfer protein, partial [Novosphingobium sp. B-7]|uniref:conjugation transfer protein n=1 Tax=Novosphingobium sp. B-7 TaxID=1298855 RepID=UPI0003B3CAE3